MFEHFTEAEIFKVYNYPRKKGERPIFIGNLTAAKKQTELLKNAYIEAYKHNKKIGSFVLSTDEQKPEVSGKNDIEELEEAIQELEETQDEILQMIDEIKEAIKDLYTKVGNSQVGFFEKLTDKLLNPLQPPGPETNKNQINGNYNTIGGNNYNSTIEDKAKEIANKRSDAAELLSILNTIIDNEPAVIDQIKTYYQQKYSK